MNIFSFRFYENIISVESERRGEAGGVKSHRQESAPGEGEEGGSVDGGQPVSAGQGGDQSAAPETRLVTSQHSTSQHSPHLTAAPGTASHYRSVISPDSDFGAINRNTIFFDNNCQNIFYQVTN